MTDCTHLLATKNKDLWAKCLHTRTTFSQSLMLTGGVSKFGYTNYTNIWWYSSIRESSSSSSMEPVTTSCFCHNSCCLLYVPVGSYFSTQCALYSVVYSIYHTWTFYDLPFVQRVIRHRLESLHAITSPLFAVLPDGASRVDCRPAATCKRDAAAVPTK